MVAEAHKTQCLVQYTENQESGGRGGGVAVSGTLSCTNYCFNFEPDAAQVLLLGLGNNPYATETSLILVCN